MNNQINLTQWNELIKTVKLSPNTQSQADDTLYIGTNNFGNSKRYYCYDNYDRHDVPGFDLVIPNNSNHGTLTVYNGSEQARAPISFEQGLNIATQFFTYEGYEMSEEIVCDWVMDGNASSF